MRVIVVTDLDGTLWDSRQRIHPRTVECFKHLQNSGVDIFVATARRWASAEAPLRAEGMSCPGCILNGSIGINLRSASVFYSRAFAPDLARRVAKLVQESGLTYTAYSTNPRLDFGSGDSLQNVSVAAFGLHDLSDDDVARIRPQLETARVQVACCFDIARKTNTLMIQPKGTSKSTAVRAYLRKRRIEAPFIIAVGNGANDLDVFDLSSLAVACASSEPTVLGRADIIIDDPENGGWAGLADIIKKLS